jgi:predicted porin
MKKSLIALAIASAVSAPAFAATSNVDIYGKLNFSVNFLFDQTEDNSLTPANEGVSDIQFTSNSSRIGFKGSEDLGGGLSAIWQIESSLNIDEGNGNWASRNTFLGLKGDWGTVLGGKHDTPLKLVGRAVDLFGDTIADSRNVMGGGSDTRASNVVAYISPNFSGFNVIAAYVTDFPGNTTTAPDADDKDVYNLNATYSNGPLYIGGAYGDGNGHEAAGLGSHWRLAAGYTFGNFKVVGQYDSLEDDSTTVGTQNGDFDGWMLGASYTMGAMVFKGNYMMGEYDGVGGAEPEQWTVGMDYNLSKRTSVYALYADGDSIVLGGGAGSSDQIGSGAANGDVNAFSVGVTHSF